MELLVINFIIFISNDFLDRHNLLDDKKYHFHFSIIDLPYYN